MSFSLPDLPATVSHVALYGAACIVAAIFTAIKFARPSKLDTFPTVGSNGWLCSWGAAARFMANGVDIIQEGYTKYKSMPFKVKERDGWTVLLSNRDHIEELQKAPDEELSLVESMRDLFNAYHVEEMICDSPHRIAIIRSQLSRNIGKMYPEIREEVVMSFDEILDLKGNEWKSIPALSAIQQVISRTNNRVFVGLPLCRNPEWINLNIKYAVDIVKTGHILELFPRFLRPLVAHFFTVVTQNTMQGLKLLTPVIEERQKYWSENWTEKPNDFLMWFMEETQGSQMTVGRLMDNILVVNFAAIHSTSINFTHALLYLAANPRIIPLIREEVEAIIEKEGWTKAALTKMRKLNSFLKECLRIEGMSAVNVSRKAMKDFRFSDGTFIPKGTMIGVTTRCLQHDEEFYENPDVFEPFRFVDMQESEGELAKYELTSPRIDYLSFGYGRHVCPGRFFAESVMKTMLAHMVTTYDIKLEEGTIRPPSVHFGRVILPNPQAKVLFRRRVD